MAFAARFNRTLDRVWLWFEREVGFVTPRPAAMNEVRFEPSLWTGSFVLAAFAYQVVSGGLLLLYYQPSVYPTLTDCGQGAGVVSTSPAAWCSTFYIVHSVPMGSVLLTTHLYGAYAVIFLMMVHLFRGYYVGSFKGPGRTFSWLAGTVLLLLVLGMGFTGYLLAYTQLSYNATEVSVTLVQSLPVLGSPISTLIVGDGTPQSLLTRMFAAHVILLPVAIAVLVFLHKRTTLFPRRYLFLVKWGFLYLGVLFAVAALWPWQLPTYAGNVGVAPPATVPAWYFLWLFKLVDFVGITPEDAMLFTVVVVAFLFFLPFLDRSHRVHPRDRPVFLFLGNSLVGFLALMTVWGDLAPGVPISPVDAAWRLGPILAVNAAAVAFFYVRYRTNAVPESGPPAPETRVPPDPGSPSSPPGGDARPADVRATPSASLSTILGVSGLAGTLFLLAFGLLLPFLFLLAAFLVHLAESGRPAPRPGGPRRLAARELFPLLALLSVAFLLVASVAVVGV